MSDVTRRLEGRAVIVTGASRGIGRAIAERLASEGAKLVLSAEPGDAGLLEEAAAPCGEAAALALDLAEPDTGRRLVALCLQRNGRIDGIVNNAARHFPGAVGNIALPDWDRALRINLTAAMLLAQAAVPHFRAAGRGAIVNISSQRAFASGHGEVALRKRQGRAACADPVDGGRLWSPRHPHQLRLAGAHPVGARTRVAGRRSAPSRGDVGGDAAAPSG